jgi:hypothetical protein
MQIWEFGVLEIHNPGVSPLKPYFDLISESENLQGHLVEFGVWRGGSISTTALILKELGSIRKVYGYDTFTGFPSTEPQDDFENFNSLYEQGVISASHFKNVMRNRKHLESRAVELTPDSISTSSNFSETSEALVRKKIQYLNLDNIVQITNCDVRDLQSYQIPASISLALLDLDLYAGYKHILPILWERLVPGGYIWLDEYYSLKFPGPRIAVDEFCRYMQIVPKLLCNWLDFERWVLQKD